MRLKASIAAGLLLAALSGSAQCTVLIYKNFDQLVSEAEGIVIGTVRGVQVAPVGHPRNLNTYVTLDEIEPLSGHVPDGRLTLRLIGGFDGRHGLRVPGTPSFRQGERVLLFVQGNGRDYVPFVGWEQGVFRLQSDSAGRTVVHDADGHEVVGIRQGHVAKRSGRRLETTMVGGPGVTVQQAQRKGEPADTESAMSAADFVVAVQRKARAGSVLRSVMPGEKTALDLGGRAEPMPTNPPAAGPVARPASGSVALPLPYPQRQPASADAR